MIEATFYTNEQDRIWSFEIHGHAARVEAVRIGQGSTDTDLILNLLYLGLQSISESYRKNVLVQVCKRT